MSAFTLTIAVNITIIAFICLLLHGKLLKQGLCLFRLDLPCAVDMRQMPPSVAEVYVLTMATALKRASHTK